MHPREKMFHDKFGTHPDHCEELAIKVATISIRYRDGSAAARWPRVRAFPPLAVGLCRIYLRRPSSRPRPAATLRRLGVRLMLPSAAASCRLRPRRSDPRPRPAATLRRLGVRHMPPYAAKFAQRQRKQCVSMPPSTARAEISVPCCRVWTPPSAPRGLQTRSPAGIRFPPLRLEPLQVRAGRIHRGMRIARC